MTDPEPTTAKEPARRYAGIDATVSASMDAASSGVAPLIEDALRPSKPMRLQGFRRPVREPCGRRACRATPSHEGRHARYEG